MKLCRIMGVLAIFAALLSCKKEDKPANNNNNNGGSQQEEIVLGDISVPSEYLNFSMAENSSGTYIPVTLTPSGASVSKDVKITLSKEGIINVNADANGIGVVPVAQGSTTIKLGPNRGPAAEVSIKVTITEKPAEPVSISITKTGTKFSGGKLLLTVDESFSLSAIAKDDKGGSTTVDLTWEVVSGSSAIELDSKGKVTAKAGGTAVVKVSPASKPSISDQLTIEVASVNQIKIDRSGTYFVSGNTFKLPAGSSFTLSATVLNSRGETVQREFSWSASGSAASITSDGKVSASSTASGTSVITAALKSDASVKDQVSVQVVPNPTGVSLSGLTAGGEYHLKKGASLSFNASVLPADAIQDLVVHIGQSYTDEGSSKVQVTKSGTKYTIKALEDNEKSYTIYVYPKDNTSLRKSATLWLDTFAETDVKPGDWVYYNGNSSNPQFRSTDGGLRYYNSSSIPVKYTIPEAKAAQTISGWSVIGVVVTNDLENGEDFLGCSLLKNGRNGASATGLYEYNTLRIKNFAGLTNSTGTHALVVSAWDSNDVSYTIMGQSIKKATFKWSDKTELIAQTDDKKDGLYQYQLKNVLALSEYEANQGYGRFIEPGFVSHLSLKFYNDHLNNTDYTVNPVSWVEVFMSAAHPVAGPSTGKTTGWFAPGMYELDQFGYNFKILSKILQEGSGMSASARSYWTVMEYDKSFAYYGYKGTDKFFYSSLMKACSDTDKKYTRAFLYL